MRDQTNADFRCAPGEEFRLLLDYPQDDVGHTVEEDRKRAPKGAVSAGGWPRALCCPSGWRARFASISGG